MTIEFRSLGTTTLCDDSGQEVTGLLRQPKRVALLTYLCLASPLGLHRRDLITALLWPDLSQGRARGALRKAIFGLREALGPDALLSRGDEEVGVNPERLRCDVWAFEEALDAGRPKDALDLYRGDLLDGFHAKGVAQEFEERLARERSRLRLRAYQAAWSLAESAEQAGETRDALEWSERAAALAPDDEVAVRRLIELRARLGDRAGALGVYEKYATRLRGEYDVEPDPDTQALIASIRAQTAHPAEAPTAAPARASAPAPALAPGPVGPSTPASFPAVERRAQTAAPRRSRLPLALTTSLVVVALTAVLYVLYGWVRTPGRGIPTNSVAVLGFENLSDGGGDEYLSYGLTDETITRLGRVPGFAVASRPAAQRFVGNTGDPADIGAALGVEYLVSGTVRREGERLRVRAELVRAKNGRHVWGGSFEIAEQDLLSAEDSIARAVAFTIAGQLEPEEERLLSSRPTDNPRAYEHYMRGNYFLAERNPTAVARAIAEYQTAATVDPRFSAALAQAGYGYALYLDWEWEYEGVSRDSLFALGYASADEALRRDSTSADAWRVRAMLDMHRSPNDFAGADQAFRRALALDPRNAGALHSYAAMQTRLGNDSTAVELLHRALAVEPGRPISLFVLFEVAYREGRYEESRVWLDSALTIDPGFFFGYALRGLNRLRLGDVRGAREDGLTSVRFSAGSTIPGSAVLALVAIHQGDSAGARRRLERLEGGIAATRDVGASQDALWLAMIEVGLGKSAQAMDRLEAVTAKSAEFWFWLRLPEFDAIRGTPRFERLFEATRPRPRAPQQVALLPST